MPNIQGNAVLERLDVIAALLRDLVRKEQARAPRLLRLREAAAYLNISPGQLRRFIHAGDLPVVQIHDDGGHAPCLLDVRDLDQLIEKRKQ